jgi:hypothetical protein
MTPDVPFYRGLLFAVAISTGIVWGPLAAGIYVLVYAR